MGLGDGTQSGYFSPDSAIWRVSREMALMLGGGRALLMQVAHPLVAAGVAEHSDYRENPWSRLERTMSAVWSVVYGTKAEADRAAARVRALHETVNGRIDQRMGPYPAGTEYSALDPELLLWVHATLVDTALLVYRSWVRPLSDREEHAYYEDMKVLARKFGTPERVIPPTLAEFRAYMEERLASDEIAVTDTAREIADGVMHPPLPAPFRPLMELVKAITTEMLPADMREQYGLRWDPARAALVTSTRQWTRRVLLPLLPDLARAVRMARRAEKRAPAPVFSDR